jgi:hypothetical protein
LRGRGSSEREANRQDPTAYQRVARAHHKLRAWKKCKIAVQLALSLDPGDADKKILQRYQKDAEKILCIKSSSEEPHIQQLF